MNKKMFLTIPLFFALIVTLFASNYSPLPLMNIVWAVGSTPDAYGNRICSLVAEQKLPNGTYIPFTNGYSYNGLVENFEFGVSTAVLYNSGQTWWRVADSYSIIFDLCVYLNASLAIDATQAQDYTRANITITGGGYSLTNQPFTGWTGSAQNATYWKAIGIYNWTASGYPAAGVTYNCTITYEAYA